MTNLNKSAALALLCLCLAVPADAASVAIEWQDPGKYRDMRAGNEGQRNFEQRVTAALTRSFEDAAADHLPAEQTLRLTITDVDLAGDVEYFFVDFPQGIRVMRDVYFPSIRFAYELRDAGGNVIASGEENIKDMGYRFSGMNFINDPEFNYEDRLIHDWVAGTFD
jgi:hypothetical protein